MSIVDRAAGSVTSGPAAALPAEVRVVVFDVVGTLVAPRPAVAVAYQRAAARHGVERGVVEIEARFRDAWCRQEAVDAASRPSYATSPERERERWRAIVADVFEDAPATEQIFADLWAHFASPAAWCQTERGPALVRWALDAGRGVALASNFDDRLLEIARHVEPLPHAGRVFTSAAIGWRKPALEFFRHVEERLGCAPGEIMLVGDDPLLDLAAGRRAGWHVLGVA